jgi:hypothetical protein
MNVKRRQQKQQKTGSHTGQHEKPSRAIGYTNFPADLSGLTKLELPVTWKVARKLRGREFSALGGGERRTGRNPAQFEHPVAHITILG